MALHVRRMNNRTDKQGQTNIVSYREAFLQTICLDLSQAARVGCDINGNILCESHFKKYKLTQNSKFDEDGSPKE